MKQSCCAAESMPDGVMVMERWAAGKKAKRQWSAALKKELVMRLLRGEPVHGVSREMAVPVYKLERWRNCALAGLDSALKERENDSLETCLEEAYRRINELAAEVERLRKRSRSKRPPLATACSTAAANEPHSP